MKSDNENNTCKILVADDSAVIRRLVREVEGNVPHALSFVEAEDGTTCLEHLSSGTFDMAFIDVNMPGISGLDALAQSRQRGNKTFVTIITSCIGKENIEYARALKAYEYLAKPFQPEDISAIINNYKYLTRLTSVLVVDDSQTARKLIEKVLRASIFNLEIHNVGDGPSALVAYQQKPYDIIFLDINMPCISGVDTLQMLRKLSASVKVVLMTADRSEELAKSVQSLDVQRFLYKPFFPDDINRVLYNLFGLKPPFLSGVGEEDIEREVFEIEI